MYVIKSYIFTCYYTLHTSHVVRGHSPHQLLQPYTININIYYTTKLVQRADN